MIEFILGIVLLVVIVALLGPFWPLLVLLPMVAVFIFVLWVVGANPYVVLFGVGMAALVSFGTGGGKK